MSSFYEEFTVMDVELAIFMDRLAFLGHLDGFLKGRPLLAAYYSNLQSRPSFVKLRNQFRKMVFKNIVTPKLLISTAIVLAAAVGIGFYLRK